MLAYRNHNRSPVQYWFGFRIVPLSTLNSLFKSVRINMPSFDRITSLNCSCNLLCKQMLTELNHLITETSLIERQKYFLCVKFRAIAIFLNLRAQEEEPQFSSTAHGLCTDNPNFNARYLQQKGTQMMVKKDLSLRSSRVTPSPSNQY